MGATLYSYFRSSAAWRVRIALAHKQVPATTVPVHLLREGGEQHAPAYHSINPQELVPALVEDGRVLTQSVAIIEYLEERHPHPPLLPAAPAERARVRAVVQAIACDIHPLDNLRVLQFLKRELGQDQAAIDRWYRHWIEVGFAAIETLLQAAGDGPCCFGAAVSMADVFLVPQVANARRAHIDLAAYPCIRAIDAHLNTLPAFVCAAPARQPDFVEN